MNTLHAKSPCCREKIYKYGNKRRQCSKCKKTWRIRKKKTGRKVKRISLNFFLSYLRQETPSVSAYARKKGIKEHKVRYYVRKSLDNYLQHSRWPKLPHQEPLIAIADAMIFSFKNNSYTFYFILLRKIKSKQAIILRPYICQGGETCLGWQVAFNRLSKPIQQTIAALVCDGHRGLISVSKKRRWILQRCHFHLFASLQRRCSMRYFGQHRQESKLFDSLIREIVTTPSTKEILSSVSNLKEIAKNISSYRLRSVLRGFVRNYKDYRHYLTYPHLKLPTTTNSAESLISSISYFCNRARGFRTINSLTKWVTAFLKNKKSITCNGYFSTKLV